MSLEAFDVTTVAKDAYSFHSSYKIPKRKHIPDPVMEHIPDPVMEQSSIATSPEQHEQSLHKILSQTERDARKERNRNKRRIKRQNDPSHQQRTNADGVRFATSHGPVHREQAAAQAKHAQRYELDQLTIQRSERSRREAEKLQVDRRMFEERRKDLQLWLEEKKRQVEQKAYASAQSAQYYAGQVSHDLKQVVDALGAAHNHLDWFNDSHRRAAVLYNLTHLDKLDLLMKEVSEQGDEEKLRELGHKYVKHARSVLLLLDDARDKGDEHLERARNMAAECSKQAKQMQYVDWADGF